MPVLKNTLVQVTGSLSALLLLCGGRFDMNSLAGGSNLSYLFLFTFRQETIPGHSLL